MFFGVVVPANGVSPEENILKLSKMPDNLTTQMKSTTAFPVIPLLAPESFRITSMSSDPRMSVHIDIYGPFPAVESPGAIIRRLENIIAY